MSKRKWLGIVLILIGIISNFFVLNREIRYMNEQCSLHYTINDQWPGTYQIFYAQDTNFTEEQSEAALYNKKNDAQEVSFDLPCNTNFLRFDINQCVTIAELTDLYITFQKNKIEIPTEFFLNAVSSNMIDSIEAEDDAIKIRTSGDDANVTLDIQSLGLKTLADEFAKKKEMAKNIIICLIFDFILFYLYRHASQLKNVLKETYQNREMILRLSKNDFMAKFAGSYFGMVWAFVQPVVTVLIYWFVFQMGFRTGSVGDTPFVLWLVAGLVPWFYISDAISSGSNCLIEYSYLVKKVVFNVSILPMVKVLSALFVHFFFLAASILICAAYGYYPDWYTLQLGYYLVCMVALILGITYLSSSLMVFFRDLGQIVNIFLQIGMWLTPIMWQITMLPEKLQVLMKLNPMYYIVAGYRDCLTNKIPFWQNTMWTLYFWVFSIAILMIGMKLFDKLKVHFADVL